MRLKSTIFALLFGALVSFGDTVPNATEAPQPATPPAQPPPQQISKPTAKDAAEELLTP